MRLRPPSSFRPPGFIPTTIGPSLRNSPPTTTLIRFNRKSTTVKPSLSASLPPRYVITINAVMECVGVFIVVVLHDTNQSCIHAFFLPRCLLFIVVMVGKYLVLRIFLVCVVLLSSFHSHTNATQRNQIIRDEADDENRLRPGMR